MSRPRIVAATVGVAGLLTILAGCYGPATGNVETSGLTYTAFHSKQYQIDVGYPWVFISYQCHGDTGWRETPRKSAYSATTVDGDTIVTQAYCANGIATAHPDDAQP